MKQEPLKRRRPAARKRGRKQTFRAVVLSVCGGPPPLLTRGVLYTAITRARELLVMVGDDAIPGRMAENDRRTRRYSGLRRRLKQGGPSHGHE